MKKKNKKKNARIYYGCPFCIEPKTTLEKGEHVFISATTINYGAKCKVVINCSVCGYAEDITDKVRQVSKVDIDLLLQKDT